MSTDIDLRPCWLVEQLMREYGLTEEEALAVLAPPEHEGGEHG